MVGDLLPEIVYDNPTKLDPNLQCILRIGESEFVSFNEADSPGYAGTAFFEEWMDKETGTALDQVLKADQEFLSQIKMRFERSI